MATETERHDASGVNTREGCVEAAAEALALCYQHMATAPAA